MNYIRNNIKMNLGIVITTAFLTACGGGGNNDDNTPVKETPKDSQIRYNQLTGTAFSATPLEAASVTAVCKDGTGFKAKVTTDAQGKWKGDVNSTQLPCRLEVISDQQVYHGYAIKTGNVNLNPLTDLLIANATNQVPSIWYKTGSGIDEGRLKASNQALIKELKNKGYSIDESKDLINTVSNLSSSEYQVIKDLTLAIAASKTIVDINALLLLVKDGNLTQIPQKLDIVIPWKINLLACASTSLPTSSGSQYGKCSSDILTDFEENNLIDLNSNDICSLKKQGDTITLKKNATVLSVILDQEPQDGVYIQNDGIFNVPGPIYQVIGNTGIYDMNLQYTQGIVQFSKLGQPFAVYFKSPTKEVHCVNPEIKKIIEAN
ncbi:hypothetical protein [Acinetobacter defluvii]|uniref:hypothetical protein n=1 Tax=Acinetobacter defluvii TaxID=1871111 RepID=UPI003AF5723B